MTRHNPIGPEDGFLPYARHCLDDDDIDAVRAVLGGDWLTTGPAIEQFESAFAQAVDAPHAVVCSSGTAALHLAMLASNVSPGDVVIVPSMTFLATANAVRYAGGEVMFSDVDPNSGLMRPQDLELALKKADGRPVKAITPVHLNGQCVEMDAITEMCTEFGAVLIEDACHALGTGFEAGSGTHKVGSCTHGLIATFSLHAVKTITAGEGGIVTTRDEQCAGRMRNLRNHGLTRDPASFIDSNLSHDEDGAMNPWHYEMQALGFNYRATDIQCALALSQLQKMDRFVMKRRALASRYDERLVDLDEVVRPIQRVERCMPCWHLYVVQIDFEKVGISRGLLMRQLREDGIGTQVHYIPVHRQPYYRERYGPIDLPGAEAYFRNALSLPLFPAMREEDVDRVVGALKKRLCH